MRKSLTRRWKTSSAAFPATKKDEVDFVKKVEMDWEHGRKIYEVSFYKGGFEYGYGIDAVTGRVLKFEKDWD